MIFMQAFILKKTYIFNGFCLEKTVMNTIKFGFKKIHKNIVYTVLTRSLDSVKLRIRRLCCISNKTIMLKRRGD